MGSLCEFLFFWQALFVHGKPIFSARQVTKKCKKIGPGSEPRPASQQYTVHTTGPLTCTALHLLRDHVQTQRCLQISAAHPPSTHWDANGKPVCIYLVPAGFVCAWRTNFLRKTSEKKCKKFPVRKQWGLSPRQPAKVCGYAYTTGPPLCTAISQLRDHVETVHLLCPRFYCRTQWYTLRHPDQHTPPMQHLTHAIHTKASTHGPIVAHHTHTCTHGTRGCILSLGHAATF